MKHGLTLPAVLASNTVFQGQSKQGCGLPFSQTKIQMEGETFRRLLSRDFGLQLWMTKASEVDCGANTRDLGLF